MNGGLLFALARAPATDQRLAPHESLPAAESTSSRNQPPSSVRTGGSAGGAQEAKTNDNFQPEVCSSPLPPVLPLHLSRVFFLGECSSIFVKISL